MACGPFGYRGCTVQQYRLGNGQWVIWNELGHRVGAAYDTSDQAMDFIDTVR